jgi:sterol desaturase/sphingolipid hydroxylase (fatty acid hydroxylase superfamily)
VNDARAFLAAPLMVGAFALLAWGERRRKLRASVEPKSRRLLRNAAMGALSAAAAQIALAPLASQLTRRVEAGAWGLLPRLNLPPWLEILAALVIMDYTFYLWHIALHRVPFLWRIHVAHHADLDLDVSTALRFHFGEVLVSAPLMSAQIAAIGLRPLPFAVWQTWFGLCVMFHHSELELPVAWERRLNRLFVTPRMHGIHHSIVREETNSNWSSGLTIWDALHGTLRLNVPQPEITIGVPAFRTPEQVSLPKIVAMPFVRQPDWWTLPGDGTPERAAADGSRRTLAP